MAFSLRTVVLSLVAGAVIGLLLCLTVMRPGPPEAEIQQLRARASWALGQAKAWHQVASQRQIVHDSVYLVRIRRDTVTRRETDSVLVVLERENPGCGNVVTACEHRLGIERANADDWKAQLGDQRETALLFKRSADSAIAAADSLHKALDLATRPPSFWKALFRPELRPTAGIGYCLIPVSGKMEQGPCVNAGLSLVWRF